LSCDGVLTERVQEFVLAECNAIRTKWLEKEEEEEEEEGMSALSRIATGPQPRIFYTQQLSEIVVQHFGR
jgi:hypothetical protein